MYLRIGKRKANSECRIYFSAKCNIDLALGIQFYQGFFLNCAIHIMGLENNFKNEKKILICIAELSFFLPIGVCWNFLKNSTESPGELIFCSGIPVLILSQCHKYLLLLLVFWLSFPMEFSYNLHTQRFPFEEIGFPSSIQAHLCIWI